MESDQVDGRPDVSFFRHTHSLSIHTCRDIHARRTHESHNRFDDCGTVKTRTGKLFGWGVIERNLDELTHRHDPEG